MEDKLSQLFISVLISYNQRGGRQDRNACRGQCGMHEAEDNSQKGGDQAVVERMLKITFSLTIVARIQRIYLFYVFEITPPT